MTVSKVRDEAKILRADILKGINPAAVKRETKRKTAAQAIADQSAQIVSELVDEYFKKILRVNARQPRR
jgi:hypothetical protein